MRQQFAQALAFRGHLDQAYHLLGNQELPLFAELAYLGAVPQDTAALVFKSWRVRGSRYARLALSWWSRIGDTASIEAFRRHASRLSRSNPGEAERLSLQYEVSAAEAHLALAKKDSVEALRRFQSLPDSLCLECYVDRLVRARLLASRGRYEEAINDLSEPLSPFLTPMEVVFAYEGARAAQQAGEHERAHAAYEFVARAWLHAGSELQPLVTEARSEGDRLAMRSGN